MRDIDVAKLRRLDGGLLLVFHGLVRTGRASDVARQLGLSQPAISHALARLRDLFDDPLFVRRPNGLEPTRRALQLAPKIQALVELADEALSPAEGFDPARSARVFRFAAPEFVLALIGGALLARLRRAAPGARFEVDHLPEEGAVLALRRGDLDFALGRFGQAQPGFSVQALFDDEFCVAARRGHPRVREGRISLEDWRSVGHVFAYADSEAAGDREDMKRFEIAWVAGAPYWLTALTMAAASDALVSCPRKFAERHAPALGLQVLDLPFSSKSLTVSVMRRTGANDEGVAWFVEEVRAAAGG